MLTKIKKMFVLVMFAAFAFILVGCGGGIKGALESLVIDQEVTEGFILPSADLEGAVTEWKSNSDAIVIDGDYADVTRPSVEDAEVTLTATVTLGEKTESKDFVVIVKRLEAPNAININPGNLKPVEGEKDTYYLVVKKTAKLSIEVESEEMSKEVKWTVSSTKRASIDEKTGEITGLDYGMVTVTATSTSVGEGGVAITDQIKVEVVEDTNPMQVLLNNKKGILDSLPRFISSAYTFPMAANDDVETLYTYADGSELYYGEYDYVEGVDRQETIYCTLTYKGEVTEFEFVISVVTNEEDNEFLALDYAQAELDKIFSGYVGGATKVSADIEVPAAFGADAAGYDVSVSYDEVTDYQPYPISVNTVGEGEEEKLVAVYTKPNDDAAVRIEVYFKTANVDRIVRYNVVAAGYTQAEKVEYLKANVLPQANADGGFVAECAHVTLPTGDTTGKFGQLAIEWTSSDETLITNAGKFANPDLAAEASVTLTATIKYSGTVSSTFAFEEKITFEYAVKPAANKAQSVALQLSNFIDAPEFMDQIKYFPFGKTDRLDESGAITNVMPLPTKIGDIAPSMTEFADIEITWTASEEGLLDENFKLLKQYLRYHEVVLTYAVTVDGNTATSEVVINVGITEVKNAIYIGGNYYQQSGGGIHTGDVLSQLSKFDSPVGVLPGAAKTWGYSYSYGQFNGYTWYVDEEVDGVTTRYQYFAHAAGFITLDDQYKIELADPTDLGSVVITINEELNKYIGSNYGGNWAAIYHNVTDKEVKIPLSPYTGGPSPFKDETGAELKWTNHPWKRSNLIDRENAFGMDGYRVGFVTDANGVVIAGNGETQFQANHDVNNDGAMTDDDFWVTIPAGGYAYTTHTQQNNATVVGRYCVVGTDLHISYFDPYFLSPDGSADGLNSWTHE